jgi:hypothetical protein
VTEAAPKTFVENLLELMALVDPVDGDTYLKRRPLDDLIQSSQAHTGFFPFFTDDELALMVKDPRIDWQRSYVSSQDNSDRVTLLSHLLYTMEMNQYLTWLPSTAKALNERYTPAEQVVMLRKCETMPGGNGSLIDGRHLLAGRIVPLILQSEEHLDAWVDAWFKGIKSMEARASIFESFSKVNPVTKAYKRLPNTDEWLCRTPMLMTLAGALDHESVMQSVGRYTSAPLYDICSGDFTGHLNMCGKDFARKNLSYGLFLLHGPDAQELTGSLLSGVMKDRHFELSSAILAVSVNFKAHSLPLEELAQFKDPHSGQNALDNMLQDHAFSWRSDWFQKLKENPHCDSLRKVVLSADRFETWCTQHARRNGGVGVHGSIPTLKKIKVWLKLLSEGDQERCLEFAINKFQTDITSRSKYGQGILFAKILLSVFPENERATGIVKDLFGALIKRSLAIKDKEIVAEVLSHGLVSVAEIGPKISSMEEFDLLTSTGGIHRDELLPHVKHTVKGKIFTQELGV